jgi:YesN/AraC family two-component response regulator
MPIDLLFTDVIMPGPLKSTELARKARERMPNLAVLFTSGYTEDAFAAPGSGSESVELLSKPYSRDALARKLRQMLAESVQRNLQPFIFEQVADALGPARSQERR